MLKGTSLVGQADLLFEIMLKLEFLPDKEEIAFKKCLKFNATFRSFYRIGMAGVGVEALLLEITFRWFH